MPVLTESELRKREAMRPVVEKPVSPKAPDVPAIRKPKEEEPERIRMFHPDDIQSGTINCEFDLAVGQGIEKIKIERGVAAVTKAAASILESRGWIRGKEVKAI